MHIKKHLSFKAMISFTKEKFDLIKDKRAMNTSNGLSDVLLSGLACMYFQCPSLLDFQKKMEEKLRKNNLRSMFKVATLPTDNGMRNIIDSVDTKSAFGPVYHGLFMRLQRGKHLEQYQVLPDQYLVNVDGTQYYQSKDISCNKCLTRGKKGKEYHCHQVLQAAVVKPGLRQVIPLMPEEICIHDGDEKGDCEVNAFARFMSGFRRVHDKLWVIINGDAIFANTSAIRTVHEHDANYIFKVKKGKHQTLFKNVAQLKISRIDAKSRRGNNLIIEFVNDVELFKTSEERTNYIVARELVAQKGGKKDKVQYLGSWITDITITTGNAKTLLDCARARWKIENECFNTLKNHGYNIEHNYGHGTENLCYNFYNFTLLAFFMHQIHQLTDNLFKKVREKYGRMDSLWQEMRTALCWFYFDGMEELWLFLSGDERYRPQSYPVIA